MKDSNEATRTSRIRTAFFLRNIGNPQTDNTGTAGKNLGEELRRRIRQADDRLLVQHRRLDQRKTLLRQDWLRSGLGLRGIRHVMVRAADHAVMEVWLMVGPLGLRSASHEPAHQHHREHCQQCSTPNHVSHLRKRLPQSIDSFKGCESARSRFFTRGGRRGGGARICGAWSDGGGVRHGRSHGTSQAGVPLPQTPAEWSPRHRGLRRGRR